jgi:hypothetical protein
MKKITFVPHEVTFFPFCSFVGELTRLVGEIKSKDIFSSDENGVMEVTVEVSEKNEQDVISLFKNYGWHKKEEEKGEEEEKNQKKQEKKKGGAIF